MDRRISFTVALICCAPSGRQALAEESWQRLCPEAPVGLLASLSVGNAEKESPLIWFQNTTSKEVVARLEIAFINRHGEEKSTRLSSGIPAHGNLEILHHGMAGMKRVVSSTCRVWGAEQPVSERTQALPYSAQPAVEPRVIPEPSRVLDETTLRLEGPRCKGGPCPGDEDNNRPFHPGSADPLRKADSEFRENQRREHGDFQHKIEVTRDQDHKDQEHRLEDLQNAVRQNQQREYQINQHHYQEQRDLERRDEERRDDNRIEEQQREEQRYEELREQSQLDEARHSN